MARKKTTKAAPAKRRARRPKKISVLICDAQPLFADALSLALQRCDDFNILAPHPATGVEAVHAAGTLRPQVALLDYWLDGMEGPAVVAAIARAAPKTKVLHLSWFHGPQQITESLAAGAVGFLPKGLSVAEVDEAIHRAQAGENPVYGAELEELVARVEDRRLYIQEKATRFARLTRRELEVLRLISVGLVSLEVAERLKISDATARSHIHHILAKTGATSQLEAVAMARDQGLVT